MPSCFLDDYLIVSMVVLKEVFLAINILCASPDYSAGVCQESKLCFATLNRGDALTSASMSLEEILG